MKCDICGTTSGPSYYTPKDLHGVVVCPKCYSYCTFIDWHLTYQETITALKKINSQREIEANKAAENKTDVMVLRKE